MNVKDMDLIKDVMQLSVTEVIEAMTAFKVNSGTTNPGPESNVGVSISCQNGLEGAFYIFVEPQLAKTFAKIILKKNYTEVNEEVFDTVGEILNIIVGKFKAVLTSHNYELFDFSPPTRRIKAKDHQKVIGETKDHLELPFETENGQFSVEMHFG